MQLAAIEFARNVLQLPEATSMEFKNDALTHIIVLLEGQQNQTLKGATMRLGAFPCLITPHTKAWEVYKQTYVSERHRHRYEFNKDYFTPFTDLGMVFSGMSPSQELVEIMELKDHPWFVACQFHPELKSKPTDPHPLFRGFLGSAVQTSSIR
jgi:CTP synthase